MLVVRKRESVLPWRERVSSHEHACRRQFSWRFKDSAEAWNRNPRSYRSRIAIDGSSSWNVQISLRPEALRGCRWISMEE